MLVLCLMWDTERDMLAHFLRALGNSGAEGTQLLAGKEQGGDSQEVVS